MDLVKTTIAALIATIIFYGIAAAICLAQVALPAKTGTASWYSSESCKREGTSGIMANGRRLNDGEFIAASWDFKFGTRLKVTNLENGKATIVVISDRGPSIRLYRKGRILDLSKSAFAAIACLRSGIIKIRIEEI